MSCTIVNDRLEPQRDRSPCVRWPHSARWECWTILLVAGFILAGCGGGGDSSAALEEDVPPEFTYICSKSGERQVGPLRTWPYDNPRAAGGKFMLSLYCGRCNAWHAVPPPDKGRGNPLAYRCPRTGTELKVVAPAP
jgi:hypothetical protein